jgi:hypothetical protein
MTIREKGHSASAKWRWEKYENFNPLTLSNTFFTNVHMLLALGIHHMHKHFKSKGTEISYILGH